MSYRYDASFIDPGLNTLVAPIPSYTYELWSWGNNSIGTLGLGNTTNYSSPKQIGSLTTWNSVNCGNLHVLATKTDGTIWAWGQNNDGNLGQGNTTLRSSPVQIGALTDWSTNTAGGGGHSIAVKTDGTLWSWGYNNVGQLGVGNTTSYSSPKQVGALTTWYSVSCTFNSTLSIKTNGTLWSWGGNSQGQLGLNNTTEYSSPKQVGALTNWLKVASGRYHNIAIKTNGTLWAWGFNSQGQLGFNNSSNYYSSPKQIGSLSTWSQIACGNRFSLAIKTDGTLWGWGQNSNGQLGLSDSTNRSSPVQIGALTNWLYIAAGSYHTISIKTDGTIWAWGYNDFGQLGNGTAISNSSPVQIGALTTWSILPKMPMSAFSLALKY